RLAMHRTNRRDRMRKRSTVGGRVALQAERVDVGHVQQPRVRRAVRRMATDAAIGLHHRMLVNERSCRLGMALDADGILLGGSAQCLAVEGAMRIMAV